MGFRWMFRFNTHLSPFANKKSAKKTKKNNDKVTPPPQKKKKDTIIPHLSGEDLLDFNVWNVASYPPTYRLHPQKNWPSSSVDLKATRRCCHGVLVGVDGPTKVVEKQRKATKRAKQSTRFPKEDFAMAFCWRKGRQVDRPDVCWTSFLLLLKWICLDKNGEMYDNKDFSIWVDV